MAEQTLRELMYDRIAHLVYPDSDGITYDSGRWRQCKEYLYDVALGGENPYDKKNRKIVHAINPRDPSLLDKLSDLHLLNYYQSVVHSAFTQRG